MIKGKPCDGRPILIYFGLNLATMALLEFNRREPHCGCLTVTLIDQGQTSRRSSHLNLIGANPETAVLLEFNRHEPGDGRLAVI